MPQWKYFNRQGAAQLVNLNQKTPESISLIAYSKADNVPQTDHIDLNIASNRQSHYDAREGKTMLCTCIWITRMAHGRRYIR
jgi:hypothetical protein